MARDIIWVSFMVTSAVVVASSFDVPALVEVAADEVHEVFTVKDIKIFAVS